MLRVDDSIGADASDVVLAGGGLANALIGHWLAAQRPELRVTIVEAGATLGGNHTWSFHTSDVSDPAYALLDSLIIARWPDQEVRFPGYTRILRSGYNTISAARLHAVVAGRVQRVITGARVAALDAGSVSLADGRVLTAPCVIDGRGFLAGPAITAAWQKFAGIEIETRAPHGLTRPIIMDATVPQLDGYRFVYTLPLGERQLLIEDTRYSDTTTLDPAACKLELRGYAAARGWIIERELREEAGVLPIPLDGDADRHWRELPPPAACSGMRALLFHAATGYSLPLAAVLAERVAGLPAVTTSAVADAARTLSTANWNAHAFYRMLNRLLFLAARPADRIRVLERFYTLPEPLIRRFYAGRSTIADKARILIGKPPVPVLEAIRALPPAAARRHMAEALLQPRRSP